MYPEHVTDKGLKSNLRKALVQLQTQGWFYNDGKFLAWLKY